ncbi:MAG TPA: peptidoglycan DD-metalloendopeptidase family protein [Gammaproteobacteria bacterium]|nr:peptidoglycan DD-metalloendopeptidase family protein [Gammaproteobacteria bacterium]
MRRRYWLSLGLASAGAILFQVVDPVPAQASFSAAAMPVAAPAPASLAPPLPTLTTAFFKIANGDTLAQLFSDRNLNPADLAAIMDTGHGTERLKRILPGDVIRVQYTPDAHVQSLRMQYDEAHMLDVARGADGAFSASVSEIPTTVTSAYAHGVIENSLFDASARAGLGDGTTMELIQLFAWDVDFAHDIQNGDSFTVLYQKIQRAGHVTVDGPILAAEFKTGGHDYRVVRFTDPSGATGYYTPDGKSIRKALMRAPVSYSRISSGFSLHRKHPILGYSRAHQGVDYAAPTGTPIHAAGDGRVVFVGLKGGYGKCMVIDHGGGYATLYGHMSRFKKGMHAGLHVTQEQVIGFVGMTGLATGPHLHFEVHVNGVPHNPRTVTLPNVAPVTTRYLADFDQSSKGLLAQLTDTGSTSPATAIAH